MTPCDRKEKAVDAIGNISIKHFFNLIVPQHFLRLFVTVPSAPDDIIPVLLTARNEGFQKMQIYEALRLSHTGSADILHSLSRVPSKDKFHNALVYVCINKKRFEMLGQLVVHRNDVVVLEELAFGVMTCKWPAHQERDRVAFDENLDAIFFNFVLFTESAFATEDKRSLHPIINGLIHNAVVKIVDDLGNERVYGSLQVSHPDSMFLGTKQVVFLFLFHAFVGLTSNALVQALHVCVIRDAISHPARSVS